MSGVKRVDLDDCHVVDIQRASGNVSIKLEQCRNGRIKNIVVNLAGVTREDVEYYVGHKVTAPHPNPALPLDYIEFAEQGPNYLKLGGYLDHESWFVWQIVSSQIEIIEKGTTSNNSFKRDALKRAP